MSTTYPITKQTFTDPVAGAANDPVPVADGLDTTAALEDRVGYTNDTRSAAGSHTAQLKEAFAAAQVAATAPTSPVLHDRWIDSTTPSAPVLKVWDGSTWQPLAATRETVRVTSNVSRSATTTLATVTGLSQTVTAGATYALEAHLYVTADATGGQQYALGGTATATALVADVVIGNLATASAVGSRVTALGTPVSLAGSGDTAYTVTVRGTITVNTGGTLVVQAAQQSASGTTLVLRGSTLRLSAMA